MRRGQLLNLHPEERDRGQEVNRGFQILELLWVRGWEVVPVHGEVDPQGVVQCVQETDELLFLQDESDQ